MLFQEKILGRSQILELVENAAQVAVRTYGLEIWGLDILGSASASTRSRPIVRIFVDTPWEGKVIPFLRPQSRIEKSKKKVPHPKASNKPLVDILSDEHGATDFILESKPSTSEKLSEHATKEDFSQKSVSQESVSQESVSQESVSIDQCAHISRMISLALEVEDVFSDAWILEVSSPGLERNFYNLSQLQGYIDHPLEVTLEDAHEDFENRKKFRGTLKSVAEKGFTLILDAPLNVECTILWENVKKAHLIHIFPDTALSRA